MLKLIRLKTTILLFALLWGKLYANGIEIVINPINPYSFGTKDFANLTVINSGTDQHVYLKSVVKSSEGRVLIEAKSSKLLLKAGTNMCSPINLSYPVITYNDQNLKLSDQRIKSLPAGNYEYCVEVSDEFGAVILGNECIAVQLELLTPPILITPENGAELENTYPALNWIPPMPVPVNVKYQLTVVQVREGQTSIDALLRNPPVHQTSVSTNFYQYPVNAVKLEKGKKYAWQVKALMNESPTEQNAGKDYKSESEVFDFIITPDPEKPEATFPFVNINTFGSDKVYYANDTLKILYKEEYKAGKSGYRIYNENQEVIVDKKISLGTMLGENLFEISISALELKKGMAYWFELQNPSGKIYKIKFIRI